VSVAVLGDPFARDVLHHEVRATLLGCPRIKDLGNIGMIHHGQGLTLRLKTGHNLLGVHPEFDDLERYPPADGLYLFGEVDRAHAALADDFEDSIRAYALRGTLKV
jgi:hypothetical protein